MRFYIDVLAVHIKGIDFSILKKQAPVCVLYYDGDVNIPAFITAKNLKSFIPNDLSVTSSQVEFWPKRRWRQIARHAVAVRRRLSAYGIAQSARKYRRTAQRFSGLGSDVQKLLTGF